MSANGIGPMQAVDRLSANILRGLHEIMGRSGTELGHLTRPFIYATTAQFADAAAAGSSPTVPPSPIRIDSTADFVCTHVRITARADDTGQMVSLADATSAGIAEIGGWPDVPLLVQFEDGSGDRLWHNQAVDAWSSYGPGSWNAGQLSVPRRILRQTTINTTLSVVKQMPAGIGLDVEVQFVGYKVFVG